MRVHVLALCDRLDGLARTSGDLDAQSLGYTDFSVTYLVPELDAAASNRLDDLVSRRPNLARVHVEDDNWAAGVLQATEQTTAESVLVVKVGDGLYPEALDRLAGLAEQGHDVVVGRRVGQSVWGAAESRGPVAAVLAPSSSAKAAAGSVEVQSSVERWLVGWHDALLAAAISPTALEDYPALAPVEGAVTVALAVQEATADWEGTALVLGATLSGPVSELDPRLVVRGRGGITFPLQTDVQISGDAVRLAGRLDLTTASAGQPLADGDWNLGVEAWAPGRGAWAPLPRTSLSSALVAGRPVAPTLRGDKLQLQVGAVRRRYFRADPADAVITESVAGVELLLPIQGLHVAQTETVHGLLLLGGLKIPAALRSDGSGTTTLQAWLSGLAGSYPISVKFGHTQPVPLGMSLVVDGVGSMTLVAASTPAAQAPDAAPDSADRKALGRIRRFVPQPVIAGLKRVPALRDWYANRGG